MEEPWLVYDLKRGRSLYHAQDAWVGPGRIGGVEVGWSELLCHPDLGRSPLSNKSRERLILWLRRHFYQGNCISNFTSRPIVSESSPLTYHSLSTLRNLPAVLVQMQYECYTICRRPERLHFAWSSMHQAGGDTAETATR